MPSQEPGDVFSSASTTIPPMVPEECSLLTTSIGEASWRCYVQS
jgi:hypothetical protein